MAANLPPIPMDTRLMQRVFASLLGNVAKHTPASTPMRIAERVEGQLMKLIVEDEGPGLPEGREEQVFESYARGDSSTVRKGAGLGLAISRAIVEAHGGSLRAERCDG